jgi:hypothetical protein
VTSELLKFSVKGIVAEIVVVWASACFTSVKAHGHSFGIEIRSKVGCLAKYPAFVIAV